jgi:hypothetical protein
MEISVSRPAVPARPRATGRMPSPRAGGPRSEIHVLENPLFLHDRALGETVERDLHRLLDDEGLGRLEVRFRVCRDDPDGIRFICKVEGAAPSDPAVESAQWRWWSPLMTRADDFREALGDAVEIRRQRLAAGRHGSA